MNHTARRVVTGHDHQGRSIITTDEEVQGTDFGPANVMRIWATTSFPSDNQDEHDGAQLIETLTSAEGTAAHIVDWAPGQEFAMHRTATIDFFAIISGELTVELDSGDSVVLRPGDTIVQRGTEHLWRNHTDKWCRTVVTMVAANPVEIEGETKEVTLR